MTTKEQEQRKQETKRNIIKV